MSRFIALIADATGRYATVAVQADTWNNAIDQLEDAGCEVIENQSQDYEEDNDEALKDMSVLTINELLNNSDFVAHP
ncbi:MAG: hypothetical protein EBU08_11870 [Micrococcales bacterium]|nr:hypothetical protein [Micrococcales bacterium]